MTFHASEALFLSEEFSDVTFIVENESVPGHKMLLAANCPYFKTMLFGATNESKMSTIELKNVSHKMFVEVLRCVYLGKVEITEWSSEEVLKLIQLADEYQFPAMGCVIANAVNVDTQIEDILEDVVGVAKRLNCVPLMEKCAKFAQKSTPNLLKSEEAFDKLPMELISYLIEKGFWHPTDVRLVFSIANWRKTASIEDKKVLLSKIDWKSLPGKYSEPLVRMFLENDLDGLQTKDWTNVLKCSSALFEMMVGVYFSCYARFENLSHGFSYSYVVDNKTKDAYVFIYFREQVTNVTKISFHYNGKATISLKLYGDNGETIINGTSSYTNRSIYKWEFDLPSSVNFLSVVINIVNEEYGDKNFSDSTSHYIEKFEFCCD